MKWDDEIIFILRSFNGEYKLGELFRDDVKFTSKCADFTSKVAKFTSKYVDFTSKVPKFTSKRGFHK
ncbi:hypothetical protein [Peribacillus simplex]|uniref:hypothetical protein n=1 Tax=Peribacillus simplex TaxID=1478 RepID=UPI003D28D0B0